MKVKFNRSALQEALNLVTSITPARTPKDILKCVRVTASGDAVRLCATDLEVGIHYRVAQVEVERDGDIVAPADKLAAIVRESIDDVIEIEVTETTIHIRGSDSHFAIYAHDVSQYPQVPDFEGAADVELTLGALQEAIDLCLFAAARESTRYALNGVLWEVEGKKLTLVATDGRRLAKATATLQAAAGAVPDGRVIVPAKAMGLLDRVGGDESQLAAVRFVGNQIVLACDPVVVCSNLVEGNFPQYRDIIPKDYDKKLTLPTEGTLSAVRRAALLAGEDSKGIRLALKPGAMIFSSRSPETGDAQIDMAVEYKGEPLDIGFNPQFLVDVLRVMKSDTFELHLGQADRPGLFKCGSKLLYIVMPVNL